MEGIAKTKVHNVRRVEKEKKMRTISREMLKIVTFPRAKTDGCEKCVSPTRETRNHEKWASGAGKSVVDFVHEPNSPISAAPLFRLLGSPRDTLGYAGGALAPPGALKVRYKTRKCRSWVIKMGFSCRRDAHFQKCTKKQIFCNVNQRKVNFTALLKMSFSCRRESHSGAHGPAHGLHVVPLASPGAPK